MATITSSMMPLPKNWQDFEEIVLDALVQRYNTPNFFKNGRPGQAQNGVDIFLSRPNFVICAQCKLTFGVISEKIIASEVENAKNFTPPIGHLHICTTSPRDSKIQEFVRNINVGFSIDILFWDDIVREIEKSPFLMQKHFAFVFQQISPEQVKRNNDIALLNRIFSDIHFPTIDAMFQQLPNLITHKAHFYWIGVSEIFENSSYYIYDQILQLHIPHPFYRRIIILLERTLACCLLTNLTYIKSKTGFSSI